MILSTKEEMVDDTIHVSTPLTITGPRYWTSSIMLMLHRLCLEFEPRLRSDTRTQNFTGNLTTSSMKDLRRGSDGTLDRSPTTYPIQSGRVPSRYDRHLTG